MVGLAIKRGRSGVPPTRTVIPRLIVNRIGSGPIGTSATRTLAAHAMADGFVNGGGNARELHHDSRISDRNWFNDHTDILEHYSPAVLSSLLRRRLLVSRRLSTLRLRYNVGESAHAPGPGASTAAETAAALPTATEVPPYNSVPPPTSELLLSWGETPESSPDHQDGGHDSQRRSHSLSS
jgi:hypothetical protein